MRFLQTAGCGHRSGALGDAERARKYAAELVALAPDVILANSSAAVAPCPQAPRTVPIVCTTAADPAGAGYVDSLARPVGTNHRKFLSSHPRVPDDGRDRALDGSRQEVAATAIGTRP